MLDKMSARCAAVNVASGDRKYIDGACVLTDSDGDKIFSTFDTRDVDKSQPDRGCGTHIITGGSGKYKGITGKEPFACIAMPALAGRAQQEPRRPGTLRWLNLSGSNPALAYPVTESLSLGLRYSYQRSEDLVFKVAKTGSLQDDYQSHKVLLRAQWEF